MDLRPFVTILKLLAKFPNSLQDVIKMNSIFMVNVSILKENFLFSSSQLKKRLSNLLLFPDKYNRNSELNFDMAVYKFSPSNFLQSQLKLK